MAPVFYCLRYQAASCSVLSPGSPLESDAMTVAAYQGFGSLEASQSPSAFWMCAACALVLAAICFVVMLSRVTKTAVNRALNATT